MTTIMTPTWAIDGVTFNVADADVEWIIHEDEGWDNPPELKDSLSSRMIGAGSYDSVAYPGTRLIVLDGLLRGSSRTIVEKALRKLALVGGSGLATPLVRTDEELALQCMVKRAARPSTRRLSPTDVLFQLSLVAPDPRKYSAELHSTPAVGLGTPPTGGVLWDGPAGGTGLQWGGPAGGTGVIWQGAAGTPGIVTVTNAGNEPAPLQFAITDSAEAIPNPGIQNLSTGEVIAYSGVLPMGSLLEIDADPEAASVLVDGSNRGPSLSRAEFFTVPPETSIQILFTSTAPAPGASLVVRWRDTYI